MDLHKECEIRIRAAVELARERYNFWMPYPRVAFVFMEDDEASTWAHVTGEPNKLTITINEVLLELYYNKFFDAVLTHEVAHVVAIHRFNDWGHGNIWANIMLRLGDSAEEFYELPHLSSNT
jgi:predicted SprT family Zn-dependent metalloprotease